MGSILRTLLLLIGCSLLRAQSPAFEVASVKPAPARVGEAAFVNITQNAARAVYSNVTLKLLISIAYQLDDDRITGGESWIESSKYDVQASLPTGSDKTQIPAMLRTLLAERFGLTTHTITKSMPAYSLVVGRNGHKLKPAEDSAAQNYILRGHIVGPYVSTGALASMIGRQMRRPVIDDTKLTGFFNVNLGWTPDDAYQDLNQDGPPLLPAAISSQLGLELRSTKAPIDFLVIDHANQTPVE